MKEKLIKWLRSTPRTSHTIRTLAGAYLIYLSYGMFTDPASERTVLVVLCGVLFAIIGLFFTISSMYALSKGYCSDYANVSNEEDEEEQSEDKADEGDQ